MKRHRNSLSFDNKTCDSFMCFQIRPNIQSKLGIKRMERRSLKLLDQKFRDLIRDSFGDNCSSRDVRDVLRISRQTSKSRKRRPSQDRAKVEFY